MNKFYGIAAALALVTGLGATSALAQDSSCYGCGDGSTPAIQMPSTTLPDSDTITAFQVFGGQWTDWSARGYADGSGEQTSFESFGFGEESWNTTITGSISVDPNCDKVGCGAQSMTYGIDGSMQLSSGALSTALSPNGGQPAYANASGGTDATFQALGGLQFFSNQQSGQ